MFCESKITGVEFDQFWYESVLDGVCYFFRWLGKRRATVLVIFDESAPSYMECRSLGDTLIPRDEAELILVEVMGLFQMHGYWPDCATPDVAEYPLYDNPSTPWIQGPDCFGDDDSLDTLLGEIFAVNDLKVSDECPIQPSHGICIYASKIASRISKGISRR